MTKQNEILNLWRELEQGQKLTLILALVVVLTGAGLLLWWSQRPQMRLLYNSLSEKDAAGIVEYLEGRGTPYEIRSGGHAIYVPADQVYPARMGIASEGLVSGGQVGFELFDNSSFGASDFIQRTNYVRAIQGELARTIMQLSGVRQARVMVVMPDNRMLLRNKDVQTTASVFVEVGGQSLSPSAIQAIQALVASSVEGLSRENVAVVDNHGQMLSRREDESGPLTASARAVEYRRMLEDYFSKKVESMLEAVLGEDRVVVRVSADVDAEAVSRQEESFDPDGTVVRSQTTEEATDESVDPAKSVQAVSMEAGQASTTAPGVSGSSRQETITKQQQYEVGRTVTSITRPAGSIRRLTVSVLVEPRMEAGADGVAAPRARTPEEIDRLRQVVADALGIKLDSPEAGSVTVQEVSFVSEEPPPEPGWLDYFSLSGLLSFGRELSGTILAIVLFLVFLRLLKRMRHEPNPWAEFQRSQDAPNIPEGYQNQTVTPELLNEMIKQKPANASAMLRNWLENQSKTPNGNGS
ncbi:flagellar M-ring protein FliF [Ruficoccus amylovorans]|uniref:Flagellar M-ring protein n=1 Tax=Ruficoccus amylovorans TaxID=1804625 RepID=A0A842HHA8_9BACT|nr:flagellar basal-body MS-ring/collar protein FliF [Ruficoccus amylovorans]MBC2595006.1 flagellar M-ring protein FliF [Ruficoccus amylovorans]